MDHALRHGLGLEGLQEYDNRDALDALYNVASGVFAPGALEKMKSMTPPKTCTGHSDEESAQVCMMSFLKGKRMRFAYTQTRGEFHRSSNCKISAISKAGYASILLNYIDGKKYVFGNQEKSPYFTKVREEVKFLL